MKVFLSWSGQTSLHVAKAFRKWLPSVIQSVEPYVSAEDIDKGARWSVDIGKELEHSAFGVLCVTKDNIDAPWLNFEAGALSKAMDKNLVCPFLFDLKPSEVDGPLLQFQQAIYSRDDIFKLVCSLNTALAEQRLDEERLKNTFNLWYAKLEEDLNYIKTEKPAQEEKSTGTSRKQKDYIFEEVLTLTRNNQKMISQQSRMTHENVQRISDLANTIEERISRLRPIYGKNGLSLSVLEDCFRLMTNISDPKMAFWVGLSPFHAELPTLYSAGKFVYETVTSGPPIKDLSSSMNSFAQVAEMAVHTPEKMRFSGPKTNDYNSARTALLVKYISVLQNLLENIAYKK